MSQADHAFSTSSRSAPTRRAFVFNASVGSAAAVFASAIPQTAIGAAPSEIFLQYQRASARFRAVLKLERKTEVHTWKKLEHTASSELDAAVEAVKARRPTSLQDVVELVQVAFGENGEGGWEPLYDFEGALCRSILALAEGGAHD